MKKRPSNYSLEDWNRLYMVWYNMKDRCYNKENSRYKSYGRRGVRVCKSWYHSFNNFSEWALKNGYFKTKGKRKITLERVNIDIGYRPSNCTWVTNDIQAKNKTTSVILTFNGKTQCLSDWAKELGFSPATLSFRLRQGLSLDKVLTSKNHKRRLIEYKGKSQSLTDWANELGIKVSTLNMRLNSYGWSIEKALGKP